MTLPGGIIGDAYRFESWTLLESLTELDHRMAGSEGEQAAIAMVTEAFADVGVRDVSTESFSFPGWERGRSELIAGQSYAHPHECIALPGTPAGEVSAPLVDVGYGLPEAFAETDVAGAIVLASSDTPPDADRWMHRREKYRLAVDAGAAGFLFRNHVPGCLPPTGDVGTEDGSGEIPALGVSREVGARLARQCEREQQAQSETGQQSQSENGKEATLTIECTNEPMDSANVSGVIGPKQTDEELLVTAHHDAHDIAEGARDNGSGTAILVEIARLLAPVASELDVPVRFVTFGAEEVGLRGSQAYAELHETDTIRAVVNCDAIGSTRDLGVYTHGFDGLDEPFVRAGEELGVPVTIRDELAPHSDHWPLVKQGVPGVMAYSVEESDDRGWGHTHGDTLDKVDRRDLRELAVVLTAAVYDLATGESPTAHVDPETIEQWAREEGHIE